MKVEVEANKDNRRLLAVVGECRIGIFFRYGGGGSIYIGPDGEAVHEAGTLEKLLGETPLRTPIYEGDTVTLKF